MMSSARSDSTGLSVANYVSKAVYTFFIMRRNRHQFKRLTEVNLVEIGEKWARGGGGGGPDATRSLVMYGAISLM